MSHASETGSHKGSASGRKCRLTPGRAGTQKKNMVGFVQHAAKAKKSCRSVVAFCAFILTGGRLCADSVFADPTIQGANAFPSRNFLFSAPLVACYYDNPVSSGAGCALAFMERQLMV